MLYFNSNLGATLTRKRAAIAWVASFVLLFIGAALSPNPKPEELAMQQGTAERVGAERGSGQEQARQAEAVSWTAHNYQVVENEGISAPRRERRRIRILAPTAVTREDRAATAVDAAIQEHRTTWPDFVVVFLELVPFEFGNVVARVDYAPDGCGVSGDNCTRTPWGHCHVNWLPRDQATISSTQTWFYCRYLGAVSACDALT